MVLVFACKFSGNFQNCDIGSAPLQHRSCVYKTEGSLVMGILLSSRRKGLAQGATPYDPHLVPKLRRFPLVAVEVLDYISVRETVVVSEGSCLWFLFNNESGFAAVLLEAP
jgi:hypothetical protein